MPRKRSDAPVLPRDWAKVLKAMELAAARTSVEAAKREDALAAIPALTVGETPHLSPPPPGGREEEATGHSAMAWESFEARYKSAQSMSGQMMDTLEGAEASVRQWILSAESLRQRLANWCSPSL